MSAANDTERLNNTKPDVALALTFEIDGAILPYPYDPVQAAAARGAFVAGTGVSEARHIPHSSTGQIIYFKRADGTTFSIAAHSQCCYCLGTDGMPYVSGFAICCGYGHCPSCPTYEYDVAKLTVFKGKAAEATAHHARLARIMPDLKRFHRLVARLSQNGEVLRHAAPPVKLANKPVGHQPVDFQDPYLIALRRIVIQMSQFGYLPTQTKIFTIKSGGQGGGYSQQELNEPKYRENLRVARKNFNDAIGAANKMQIRKIDRGNPAYLDLMDRIRMGTFRFSQVVTPYYERAYPDLVRDCDALRNEWANYAAPSPSKDDDAPLKNPTPDRAWDDEDNFTEEEKARFAAAASSSTLK